MLPLTQYQPDVDFFFFTLTVQMQPDIIYPISACELGFFPKIIALII